MDNSIEFKLEQFLGFHKKSNGSPDTIVRAVLNPSGIKLEEEVMSQNGSL